MARGSQATQPAQPRGRQAPGGGRGARGGALAQNLRSSAPSRYLLAHANVAAGLLLALFVLVYLWPVLLGGKILSPVSLLYGVAPWTAFKPHDVGSYSNALLSDVPTADYPWRFLIRQLLHEGTFPSWNPYVFGGIPLYSNPQTGLFSVFSLPLWILPLNYGIGVGAALKLWAAGFGSYLLVRQLRLGFLPGLLAGVCFSFSAINITWLTHETLPAVAALLPWMLWLVERIFQGTGRRGRVGSIAGLAVATAFGLGGGHPGMQVHLIAAVAVYAGLRALVMPRGTGWSERVRPLAIAAGGLALGVLLMGVMLVPEALSSRGTIGTLARNHAQATLPGTKMPLTVIRTVLFPDWWGRPSGIEKGAPITTLAEGVAIGVNYNERTLYAGGVGLLLAVVGLAAGGGRWRRMAPFAVLAFLGLAIPLHFPGLYQLVTNLPAFDLVQNQRLHFVWAMGMAVLAAFGLQAVMERPAGDRWRLVVGICAVALGAAAVALAAMGAGGSDLRDVWAHFWSGKDFDSSSVIKLVSGVWWLALALAVGLLLLAARRWPQRAAWVAAGIVLLAAADMLHFANRYQPMAPKTAIPPVTRSIAYLQRHRDDGRILGIGSTLVNDWTLTYGLHDIRGYDPPQPSPRMLRLWRVAEPEQLDWMAFSVGSLSPTVLQVASTMGARYVIAGPGVQRPEVDEAPERALRVVYDGPDARVFENARAAPRALAAPIVRIVPGEDETRATLVDPRFDPRREVVVERGEPGVSDALAAASGSPGDVTVEDPSNARVVLHARMPRRGLVVLNDNLTPGWSVTVDGRDARPVRVNDLMRGVVVDSGAHTVEWRYRVPGLRVGLVLTLLGLAGLVALAAWDRRTRARRRGLVV